MIGTVLSIMWFVLPAVVANMAPPFVRKVRILDYPLDGHMTWRGRRVFGAHKTWRGLIFGVLVGVLTLWLQKMLWSAGIGWQLVEYNTLPVAFGGVLGFIALLGDAIESFIKRQLDISEGKAFVPWDQIDFLILTLLVTIGYWYVFWIETLLAVIVYLVLIVCGQRIGYWLKLKDDPL